MSRLILVRHAQASFFSKNYDKLSELGEKQAHLLGEFWLRRGVVLDDVITGPRERHQRTAELVGEVYRKAGAPWPKIEFVQSFDEHTVDQLLGAPLEKLQQEHPQLEKLVKEYKAAKAPEQMQRTFQRLFEAVSHLWCELKPGTESIEGWASFHERVGTGLEEIFARPGQSRTIALFTSVGNVTSILCRVLKCSPTQALELGWRLKNCSLTEFIFSGDRITLDHFNGVPHLTDPGTWTFR